ncbi:AraC family transcriptional regulator [Actinomadura rupiterrae]|uniref:AraC family transcriptional regulator n=1 Tax=Actinomadura rupiterrae TaxID=559627 RepID=UPI0020A24479|nr:helix-turn-helix domain-containing protein [Actinomadura rupiterrae]MCP2342780.1 AraC-like DNA-binding protein [Actinomadura rupiterrae]
MRAIADKRDDAAVWDVVRPARPSRVPGVVLAGFRRGASPADHRFVPHASVTVGVDLGASPPILEDAEGRPHRGGFAMGIGFGAARVRGENVEGMILRMTPVAARVLLEISPTDAEGAVTGLDDVWGPDAPLLREQLLATSSWEERFALTEALIVRRYEAGPPVDPEIDWAWRRMAATRGRVRVDRLAAEVGWSRKRLWSRFHAQIGLPPKRAARLVRFDHAAHRLASGEDVARVAADGGYTDQSHLHRDFAEFVGATPAVMATESRRATAALGPPARRPAPLASPVIVPVPGPAWSVCT